MCLLERITLEPRECLDSLKESTKERGGRSRFYDCVGRMLCRGGGGIYYISTLAEYGNKKGFLSPGNGLLYIAPVRVATN